MAKPTDKHPAIERLISNLAGHSRAASVRLDTCNLCGKEATNFRDDRSRREFSISGMCQACQDKVFGVE